MSVDKKKKARLGARNALTRYLQAERCTRMWCFTDPGRRWLAEAFCEEGEKMGLTPYLISLPGQEYQEDDLAWIDEHVKGLTQEDLVLSVFSGEAAPKIPFFRVLPNLRAPEGFAGVSAAVRQRYNDEALLTHLLTDIADVDALVEERLTLNDSKRVRVTAPGGTDLTCELMKGFALPYKVSDDKRHAFLPASEVTFGIVPGTATGCIVVDVTVGEIGTREDGLIDSMGLVDSPVEIVVESGYVTEITGGKMAARLQSCLKRLDNCNRLVIELGLGLSKGTPTGQIGPDECLQGTGHFGLGNDFFYGRSNMDAAIHLDIVFKNPTVEILEWRA